MKQRCLACGLEKDTSINEVYPYPEDGLTDEPIKPLMTINCQGTADWRIVTVCHSCFHKLNADMWISEQCWQSLNPLVPFEALQKLPAT